MLTENITILNFSLSKYPPDLHNDHKFKFKDHKFDSKMAFESTSKNAVFCGVLTHRIMNTLVCAIPNYTHTYGGTFK